MSAQMRCFNVFIAADYRRFPARSEARPTPGFVQCLHGKTGYGSLPRFPLGLFPILSLS